MKEQARFTEISYSSLMEVLNELITSFDLELISESTLIDCRIDVDCISNRLGQLHHSQVRRLPKK